LGQKTPSLAYLTREIPGYAQMRGYGEGIRQLATIGGNNYG